MTLSDIVLRDPAILSYGLCALAFLAFVVHLGLGWRGGAKATLLLAVVAMSATWAALNVAFGVTEAPVFWRAQALVDSLRVGGWIVFLALVLGAARRTLRWSAALLVLPVVAIGLPPVGPGSEGLTATRAPFAALLGVAVFGLVLAEQVFRRAREQARWSVKPLCIGWAASSSSTSTCTPTRCFSAA